jgi:hypothetical protein
MGHPITTARIGMVMVVVCILHNLDTVRWNVLRCRLRDCLSRALVIQCTTLRTVLLEQAALLYGHQDGKQWARRLALDSLFHEDPQYTTSNEHHPYNATTPKIKQAGMTKCS